jgi:hypothetical protein
MPELMEYSFTLVLADEKLHLVTLRFPEKPRTSSLGKGFLTLIITCSAQPFLDVA